MAEGAQRRQVRPPYEVWRQSFDKNVSHNLTADRAWRDIQGAGLAETALRLLWQYADPGSDQFSRLRKDLRSQASLARAAVRAERIAERMRIYQEMEALRRRWDEEDAPIKLRPFQAPSPKQPEFFGRRAQQKFAALRNRTRLDEPADDQASILKVLANDRGLFRPFLYLHMLKACADGRSVSLGIKRLAALAECASPDASVNPETIGRYFQSVEKKFPNLRRGLLQRYRQPPSQSHS